MATRRDWIKALRRYRGVKFLHQGRSIYGLDCIGLLSCAAHDIGIYNEVRDSLIDYERAPAVSLFREKITDYLEVKPYNRLQPVRNQAEPGDVFVFWIDKENLPRHVAVYTGVNDALSDYMIHAYAKAPHCVVEMPMDGGYWIKRLDSIWRLPQLED